MGKAFEGIDVAEGMLPVACFEYAHPVIVAHMSYMTAASDERFALKRFLLRIIDSLNGEEPLPVDALAALCGVSIGELNNTLRHLKDRADIVDIQPGVYRIMEVARQQYFDEERPRQRVDVDFLIDSLSRDELPLAIYNSPYRELQPLDAAEVDTVCMTSEEKDSYATKLRKATAQRKQSLGFPDDASDFKIEDTSAAALAGFRLIYLRRGGDIMREVYYNDACLRKGFANSAMLQCSVKFDGEQKRLLKQTNVLPENFSALTDDEIQQIFRLKFNAPDECKVEVKDHDTLSVTLFTIKYTPNRMPLFDAMQTGHFDMPIYNAFGNATCGTMRFYLACGNKNVEKLLQFYSATRSITDKEAIIRAANDIGLSWRKALVTTGQLQTLEKIDIQDFILSL